MSLLAIADEHKVKVDVFDGPLDLLLYLIKKSEVDIYDIPIEQIADQYMEYMSLMRMLDLNIAGEFIVMAATLMLIKSRMLLPPEERPPLEEEEEDPRWELVKQLIEYRKFKEAASFLHEQERLQENIFTPETCIDVDPEMELALGEVNIFDLISVFNAALKRLPTEDLSRLFAAVFSVADKIESVLGVLREKDPVSFSSLFESATTRQEIACTFIAVLELIRLRQVRVTQEQPFSEIMLARAVE